MPLAFLASLMLQLAGPLVTPAAHASPPATEAATEALPDGLSEVTSPHDVATTVARLTQAIEDRDLTVFATLDHAAGAARVGQSLRPTTLVLFGSPKAGTPVMQAAPRAGLDLPLRVLVWHADDGTTRVTTLQPRWIAARHGASDAPPVPKMTTALRQIVTDAVAPTP